MGILRRKLAAPRIRVRAGNPKLCKCLIPVDHIVRKRHVGVCPAPFG